MTISEIAKKAEARVAVLREEVSKSTNAPDSTCVFCKTVNRGQEKTLECIALDAFYCKLGKCSFYKEQK